MAENVSARIEKTLTPLAPHVHWLVRLGFAGIFLYHGIDKFQGGAPPQGALDAMFLGSAVVFWLVALAEVVGAVFILAGGLRLGRADLLTRLGGLMIAVVMIGAALIVHLPEWHFARGGAEFQVFTAAVGLYLFARGNEVGGAS